MSRFDWWLVPSSPVTEVGECGPLDEAPWVAQPVDRDPHTVWAAPHAVQRLLDLAAAHFDGSRSDRVVLFSGSEMPLSAAFGQNVAARNATVARLRKYFKRILFQTKDVHVEHVHLAPMGFSWGYMSLVLREMLLQGHGYADFLRVFSASLEAKTRSVLAAWGRIASWLDGTYVPGRLARLHAQGLLWPPSNSSLLAVAGGHRSRSRLRAWLEEPAARAAGVEFRDLRPLEWWRELPKYRFLLAAPGSGIQTAKVFEALLVLTVPVVQRVLFATFDELAALGFPIVVVRGWNEVTPSNLDRWWRALSPRLERFRRNCLSVDGYWGLYTGHIERCE